MKDDPRLASVIDAPGLRAHLVTVSVTLYRDADVVHFAGQRLVMLTVLSLDCAGWPRALAKFSLN